MLWLSLQHKDQHLLEANEAFRLKVLQAACGVAKWAAEFEKKHPCLHLDMIMRLAIHGYAKDE